MNYQDYISDPILIDDEINLLFAQEQEYIEDTRNTIEWLKTHFFIKKFIYNLYDEDMEEKSNREDCLLCFTENGHIHAKHTYTYTEFSQCISELRSLLWGIVELENNKINSIKDCITKSTGFCLPKQIRTTTFKPIEMTLKCNTDNAELSYLTFENEYTISSINYSENFTDIKISFKENKPISWLQKNNKTRIIDHL